MEDRRHVRLADVHRIIERMAEIEERLSADAEREGDETMSLVHEHGGMVLREVRSALRFGADE